MKMTKFYAPLAALLLAGAAFTSCSSDDAKSEVVPANKNWSLSIEAAAPGLDTRALTYTGENSSVWSTWKIGETMEVYNASDGNSFRGYLTPKEGGKVQDFLVTTAEGLTGSFAVGQNLRILYPTRNVTYMGQDGLFETISQKYDYSSVALTITDIDEDNKALKATSLKGEFIAQFINVQALVRFEFKDAQGAPVNISYLRISAKDNAHANDAIVQYEDPENDYKSVLGDLDIRVPAGQESDVVWAALRTNEDPIITLLAKDVNNQWYQVTSSSSVKVQNGKYYEIPVTLKPTQAPVPDPSQEPAVNPTGE